MNYQNSMGKNENITFLNKYNQKGLKRAKNISINDYTFASMQVMQLKKSICSYRC